MAITKVHREVKRNNKCRRQKSQDVECTYFSTYYNTNIRNSANYKTKIATIPLTIIKLAHESISGKITMDAHGNFSWEGEE